MTQYKLVYERSPATTLDAMLPNVAGKENLDVTTYLQGAKETCQLSHLRIKNQQATNNRHYNLQRSFIEYQLGDRVLVWTPIRRRGLSEKLLQRYFGPHRVVRNLSPLDCEVVPDGITNSQSRRARPEVAHVVRLKSFHA